VLNKSEPPLLIYPFPQKFISIITISFESYLPPFIEAEGGTKAKTNPLVIPAEAGI